MKLGVAQIRSVRGDIESNIAIHNKWIGLAVSFEASALIFPELSLTGYEPGLAKKLATTAGDKRFDIFQDTSDAYGITIGVGAPIANHNDVCIGMILFQPGVQREVYTKKYLHPDEESFFVPAVSFEGLIAKNKAALGICYELSVPEHSAHAAKNGAEIYFASVAKSVQGVDKAIPSLSEIARMHSMTVLMSNSVGQSDGFVSAGRSSIWNTKGKLVGQLSDTTESILIIDTVTHQIIKSE